MKTYFFMRLNMISPHQLIFTKHRYTASKIFFITKCIYATENNSHVDVIVADFPKAFDKLMYSLLL